MNLFTGITELCWFHAFAFAGDVIELLAEEGFPFTAGLMDSGIDRIPMLTYDDSMFTRIEIDPRVFSHRWEFLHTCSSTVADS